MPVSIQVSTRYSVVGCLSLFGCTQISGPFGQLADRRLLTTRSCLVKFLVVSLVVPKLVDRLGNLLTDNGCYTLLSCPMSCCRDGGACCTILGDELLAVTAACCLLLFEFADTRNIYTDTDTHIHTHATLHTTYTYVPYTHSPHTQYIPQIHI